MVTVSLVSSLPYTPHRHEVYDFLRTRGPAELFHDVGAASGEISSQLAVDGVDLVAFKHLVGQANVQLIEKAVSNRRGREVFYVESTVQGDEETDLIALPSADRDEFVGFLLN